MVWDPDSPSDAAADRAAHTTSELRFPTTATQTASGAVILGMGRSGTSAVASMFILAGFYAGPSSALMSPNFANPRGYFERKEVVELNDAILREADAIWYRPPRPGSDWRASAIERAQARDALETVRAEAGPQPTVVKDPRICVLLDLWLPLLAEQYVPVLVIRDPLEVAASLEKRDGTPLTFALGAWELLWTELLPWIDASRVTVVPYAALRTAGVVEQVVAEAAAELDPDKRRRIEPAAAVAAFDPAEQHHRAASGPFTHREALTSSQRELWEWLESLAPGTQTLAVPQQLLAGRPLAWTLVEAEHSRQEMAERIARQEKLLAASDREVERLRALVYSEQERLHGEIARLAALVQSEQARLEDEIRDLRERRPSSSVPG